MDYKTYKANLILISNKDDKDDCVFEIVSLYEKVIKNQMEDHKSYFNLTMKKLKEIESKFELSDSSKLLIELLT